MIDEITIEDTTNDTSAATPVSLFEDSLKKSEVKEPEVTIEMVEPVVEPEPDVETEPDPECTKGSPSPIKEEETSPIVEEESAKQPDPPVAVYEDETRMSASENSSRAQTPARQDVFIVPFPEGHEESQSSVQSTATTESNKTKKVRLELCDPDRYFIYYIFFYDHSRYINSIMVLVLCVLREVIQRTFGIDLHIRFFLNSEYCEIEITNLLFMLTCDNLLSTFISELQETIGNKKMLRVTLNNLYWANKVSI